MIARLGAIAALDALLLAAALLGFAPAACLLGHAALALVALALWLRDGRALGMIAAIAGVAGPLALLAALPLARIAARHSTAPCPQDDEAAPDPPAPSPLSGARMLDGRVHHTPPEVLGSLVAILHHGSVADRRSAVETAVRAFRPALAPLIAAALTDGDQTIRALAAAASARIAQNLALARAALEAEIAADGAGDARWRLAALLADHARDNVLLSDSQRAHLRADALALMADGAVPPAAADRHAEATLEALWAAGDHDAIDRFVAARPAGAAPERRGVAGLADWWAAEAGV